MLVVYRISGIPSTNPSPILQEDKYALNELCLRSFLKAFEDVDCEIHFILDHCSNHYEKMMRLVNKPFYTEYTQMGINGSMNHAYFLASDNARRHKYVLFQECDYIYRPQTGKPFISFLEASNDKYILSPYDHPNFYLDKNLHSDECVIKLIGGHHYRSTERNTMTWATTTAMVKENYKLLTYYGYLDGDVWYKLKDLGYQLFVPIPTFATHMVSSYLSPGYDWEALWSAIRTQT